MLGLAAGMFALGPANVQAEAGWKKQFYIESDDGDYKLEFKGRLQVRYGFVDRQNNATTVAGDDFHHSFMVRRAYLTFTGHAFTKDLTYDLTINATATAAGQTLEYGWFSYKFLDAFQVKAGLFKVPFNRQEITSSGKQQFVDRSLANERFNLDRSIGVIIHGTGYDKKIEYYLAGINGRATRLTQNVSNEVGATLRVVWNPLGEYGYKESAVDNKEEVDMTVGIAGAFYHEEPTVSATQDRVLMGNADFGVKYKRFSFQTEAFMRQTDPGAAAQAVMDIGYYAQAGFFLVPEHFEIAARASSLFDDVGDNATTNVWFNNGSLTNLGGLFDGVDEAGDADNEHEFSLALNYYIKNTNIKVQTQYSFVIDGQAGRDDITNHIALVQAQLEF